MIKICQICKKEFQKPVSCSKKEWENRVVCSKFCADIYKKKYTAWNKGKTEKTDETIARLSEKMRQDFKSGKRKSWMKGMTGELSPLYGTHHSEEHKEKISKSHLGEKHWNWKGGITNKIHLLRNKMQYKIWRNKVLEQDNNKCQRCGTDKKLQCHHKKDFTKFPELRYDVKNGKTLCIS